MKLALSLIASICLLLATVSEASASHVPSSSFTSLSISAAAMAGQKSPNKLKVKNRQQATQMVQGHYDGKVLSIQSTRVNGNPGYKAKILSADGVVFYVSIDALTGRMSRR
ncbi:PepSY domain-containing protein [Shewanella sp. Isolate11]|uniref:PepSY domain-containing protein n=1 Tax=Shewanella sp. Isolate11 TaxID=2908530 RepID=UPI001EFE149B|nr:PepSY domain-containing protein [Shewanella sp. Isolate11]MCG9696113.1 PepSY domain-containing protein [Shewanella sp. Isolate11]